jgi:hypothetical protein
VLQERGTRSSEEECAQYLAQSVAAYRSALEVYTREQLPQDWALTQNNLGLVLYELGKRSSGGQSARYLNEAIASYGNALSIFTPEADPYRNETARRNLEAARRENEVASQKNPR